MKYTIEYPVNKKGYWVTIYSPNMWGVGRDEEMLAVDQWVVENRLGRRMAFNMWKLKNEKACNWFVLRWS
jgi:hypothetical protein